jgi:hypothetical protein
MGTGKRKKLISVSIFVCLWLIMSACGGNGTTLSTPSLSTIAPTGTFLSSLSTPSVPAITPTETLFPSPPVVLTPTPTCIDGLVFLDDVTIPDYSIVTPGSTLDKQWLVQNSGSCNWDSRYRLRMIAGDALGASPEQALFPARAGMQATLRIVFTAPLEAGGYYSEWQAFDAQSIPFGVSFFINIIVQ